MTRQISFRILLALLIGATSTFAFAAKSHQPSSSLPKDPAALLALAAKHNGLTGSGLKPWHIKATYQVYDAKGKVKGKGTFEEWWESPKEYKIIFDGRHGHRELISNAKGTFISGSESGYYPEYLVRHLYVDPVKSKVPTKGMKLHRNMEQFGKVTLVCVEKIPKGLQPTGLHTFTNIFPTYCMEPSNPILLIYGSYGQTLTQLTGVVALDGRYLAENAVIFDNGHKYLSVHLDKGESTSRWSAKIFKAPLGAQVDPVLSTKVSIKDEKVIAGYKISGKNPVYPETAKINHLQGKVVLDALIGKSGVMRDLVVISAPSMGLATSALAAVKTWRYKPYLLGGYPIPVVTQIDVIYNLD